MTSGGGGAAVLRPLGCALVLVGSAGAVRAQGDTAQVGRTAAPSASYPLAPSPVLDLRTLSHELRFSGYVSVRETHRNDSSAFAVNRARLTVMVAPLPEVAVRVQADLAGVPRGSNGSPDSTVTGVVLTDAYLQVTAPDSGWAARMLAPALIVGQFRVPFSLEFLTPFSLLHTADRSLAVDRLAPRRDIGLMGQVKITSVAMLSAALVNGEGSNVARNPDNKEMGAARLTIFPVPGHLAVSGKWLNEGADHRWGGDVRAIAGPALLEGEVIGSHRPTTRGADSRAGGGYVLASYRIQGWLEPVLKWERITTTAPTHTSENRATYGLNLLSRPERLRLQLDWITDTAHPALPWTHELLAQLIGIF